jgi:ATP adenylyltransferase
VSAGLAEAVAATSERALASGALEPIETEESRVADGGVSFLVRRVSSLARKERVARERATRPTPFDPFDPPDPELTVAALTPTHVAVLNKFPVIERHLLLVTRRFVDQEALLDLDDMHALALGLGAIDGIGFYNAGRAAGASQPHKHLQIAPLPLAKDGDGVPIEAVLPGDAGRDGATSIPALPFPHAFRRLDPRTCEAASLLDAYFALLAAAGLHVIASDAGARASSPYNLLATRRWMLVVPRRQECFETISVNALGFAGSLFVRDDAELETLRRAGPMQALRAVAGRAGAA